MPLLADIANRRSSQRYGVVYSTADMATSLGMIAGPLAGSFLSGWVSLPATFQTMGALSRAAPTTPPSKLPPPPLWV